MLACSLQLLHDFRFTASFQCNLKQKLFCWFFGFGSFFSLHPPSLSPIVVIAYLILETLFSWYCLMDCIQCLRICSIRTHSNFLHKNGLEIKIHTHQSSLFFFRPDFKWLLISPFPFTFFPAFKPFVVIHLIYSFELNELVLNNAIIPPAEVLHIYQNHEGKNAQTHITYSFIHSIHPFIHSFFIGVHSRGWSEVEWTNGRRSKEFICQSWKYLYKIVIYLQTSVIRYHFVIYYALHRASMLMVMLMYKWQPQHMCPIFP